MPLTSLRPLRHRRFAVLFTAGMVSNIGTWMETVAVASLVTGLTGRAVWAALVAAATFLPIGVLSPVGGALADRLNRRRFLIGTNLFEAGLAAVLAGLAATGNARPGLVVTVVFFEGCSSALRAPFQQVILPDLVPREDLFGAVTLGSAQYNLGRVVGPALAALVIARFSFKAAFAINAVSFLAVIVAVMLVPLPRPRGAGGRRLLTQVREGAVAMWAEPGCRAAVVLIGAAALFVSPFIALVPAEARVLVRHAASARALTPLLQARHIARTTGALVTAQGVGAVLGALALAPLAERIGQRPVVIGALIATPLTLMLYAFSGSAVTATAAIGLVGVAYIAILSGLSAVVQLRAGAEQRGRILSFFFTALGVIYPIGAIVQGSLADRAGLRAVTVGGALGLLAFVAAMAILRPSMLRSLQGAPAGVPVGESVGESGPPAPVVP